METINIHAAKTQLSRIVERVVEGEEIIIAKAGKPMVKLIPVNPPQGERQLGLDAGKVWIDEDFDAPMPADFMQHFSK